MSLAFYSSELRACVQTQHTVCAQVLTRNRDNDKCDFSCACVDYEREKLQ